MRLGYPLVVGGSHSPTCALAAPPAWGDAAFFVVSACAATGYGFAPKIVVSPYVVRVYGDEARAPSS